MAYPGVLIEVAVTNTMFNLTRRDADVAIRPASDPPDMLVGRRVSGVSFAAYAGQAYLAANIDRADLDAHDWIAPDDTLSGSAVARWMRTALPGASTVFRADSLVAMREAAAANLGLAALPCYLGDMDPRLKRVPPAPIADMETALWILTHGDLRGTARVRAFTRFMAAALEQDRTLLEGQQAMLVFAPR